MQPTQRQQVLLHAVVGSLVLCAVLVPPTAQAGTRATQEQHTAQPAANDKQARRHVSPQPLRGDNSAARGSCLRAPVMTQAVSAVPGNMTATANGKQLAMQLELSRAQAGNLLRQHYSNP